MSRFANSFDQHAHWASRSWRWLWELRRRPSNLLAAYTHATRYNVGGQVTGTIAARPGRRGSCSAYKATRNTYGTSGATSGLLVSVESGELSAWQSESVAPSAWSGFAAYLTRTFAYDNQGRKIRESVRGRRWPDRVGRAVQLRRLEPRSLQGGAHEQGRFRCTARRCLCAGHRRLVRPRSHHALHVQQL